MHDLHALRDSRIKLEDLQHRKLYRLLARNISIGVWFANEQYFVGIRTKFGSRFLAEEYHWDAPEFATACPLEVIGEMPEDMSYDIRSNEDHKKFFAWLEEQEKRLNSK